MKLQVWKKVGEGVRTPWTLPLDLPLLMFPSVIQKQKQKQQLQQQQQQQQQNKH